MFKVYSYSLLSVLLVSILSFVGLAAAAVKRERLNKIILLLISLSAGTLLGDSFLHLIPEAAAKGDGRVWLWLLAGMLTFFILEKIIHWRHCHQPTTIFHPHPVGPMNLLGGGLHNLIDGAIIAGSFLIDFKLGLATTVAVISHEIPQELGDFAVLLYAGYSKAKALLYNFLSALAAFIGAIVTLLLSGRMENFTIFIIPFTAGGFIYIAASDLFPELKKDNEKLSQAFLQLACVLIGIGLMFLLKKLG